MKVVCISDTHCNLNKMTIPDGDILIHAGDALSRGKYSEWVTFINRFKKLPHKHKIYVPGNHDWFTENDEELAKQECADAGIIYLNDTGIKLEGMNIWGSSVTPRFHNWAWNRDSGKNGTSYSIDHPDYNPIKPHWDLIPDDTDILITHGPPKGVMDVSIYDGAECGCLELWDAVQRVEPSYHIFGHIHNWHGTEKIGETTFINAASCTEKYEATNKPITFNVDTN